MKQPRLNILHEDNHLLVVEKPVGVLSQEDYTKDLDMVNWLKSYIKETYHKPGNVYLGLIHRLDRMVGGIMVFAKTSKAAARLNEQVRNRTFEKGYLAVVHGKTPENGTLQHYLQKNNQTNRTTVVAKTAKQAKYAELSYQRMTYQNGFSLVSIQLKTGRSHQIRVQFSHIGHPLYGDRRYGKQTNEGNIALFAHYLAFLHPTKREQLVFQLQPKSFPFNQFSIINER